jgi:hypothetical protein
MEYNENTDIHPENTHSQPHIQRENVLSTQDSIQLSIIQCASTFGINRTKFHITNEIENYVELKSMQQKANRLEERQCDLLRKIRIKERDNRQDSEQTPNILSGIKPETIEMGLNLFAQLIEKTLNKNTTI